MKIYLILAILLCSTICGYSQAVGIGTSTPSDDAILDVQSTTKGILVPRMTRVQRDGIGSSLVSTGLLIYQTNETPGFYYNSANILSSVNWVRLGTRLDTIVIGPEAFLPSNASVSYATNAFNGRYVNVDGNTFDLRAPVSIPAGATITKMNFYYYDNSSANNIKAELYKNYLTEGAVALTPLAVSTTGAVADTRTLSVTENYPVQNNMYSYYLSVRPTSGSGWLFSGDLLIKGAMIIYER